MKQGSDLPVGTNQEGAEELLPPLLHFFKSIPKGAFDCALLKLDTHFEIEYRLSPESQAFPNIHCGYGTDGWRLSFDPSVLQNVMPTYFMIKNTFDMWGKNPVPIETLLLHHKVGNLQDLPFKSDDERRAYQNLYHATKDPACLKTGIFRDEFLKTVGPDTEVIMAGVASNFCVADAIMGYLQRGAKVVALKDLVKGIPLGVEGQQALLDLTGIDRTQGGTIEEVLKTDRFAPYVQSGQFTLKTSLDFLTELNAHKKPAFRPHI
jgi:nicotinamidase/pyrazinamidase